MTDSGPVLDTTVLSSPSSGRRAAHERLSTGALARWARACATHPWRVVVGWVGIVALLVVLETPPRADRSEASP